MSNSHTTQVPYRMASQRETVVDASTPEVRESNYHKHTRALENTTAAQRELSRIIEKMQNRITKGKVPETGHDVMLELAHAVTAKTKAFTEMFTVSLSTKHTQNHHLTKNDKATEAFHIPEIAENILSNLAPEDLLRAQQVDRKIFSIIEGSSVLQQCLFLKPRLTGPFAVFPSTGDVQVHHLMWYSLIGGPLHDAVCAMVDEYLAGNNMFLSIQSNNRLEGSVGARVASMSICQPPVHVMQVTMGCCDRWEPEATTTSVDGNGRFVLKAQHGITFGHMIEAIKTIRELHSSCNCDTYGDTWMGPGWPEFETIITVEQDDPLFVRGMTAAGPNNHSEQDQNEAEEMMCM